MENTETEVPEQDQDQDEIDLAISELVDKLAPGEDDEEWEVVSDLLFDTIGELVDDEKIQDVPAENASAEEKQSWITDSLPHLEAALKEKMDNTPEDNEPEPEK
jgi:hypothetical protein